MFNSILSPFFIQVFLMQNFTTYSLMIQILLFALNSDANPGLLDKLDIRLCGLSRLVLAGGMESMMFVIKEKKILVETETAIHIIL